MHATKTNLFILTGIIAGALISFGHLPFLDGATNALAQAAAHIEQHLSNWIIHLISHEPPKTIITIAIILGIMAPGLTALLLAVAAKASTTFARATGAILVIICVGAWMYLQAGQAAAVTILAIILCGFLIIGIETIATFAFACCASMLAVSWLRIISAKHTIYKGPAAKQIDTMWFHQGGPHDTARLLITIAAALPFIAAILTLIDTGSGNSKRVV